MPRIEKDRADKARQFIYSGEAFKETDLPVERFEPRKEAEEAAGKEKAAIGEERLAEARNALFSGKLFKRGEED